MAERKISTRFAVEGEDQYKKSVADINIRLKTLKCRTGIRRCWTARPRPRSI